MSIIDTESFLQKMKLMKKKKIGKLQYPRNLYNKLSKEKEKAKSANPCMKTIQSFPKNKRRKA